MIVEPNRVPDRSARGTGHHSTEVHRVALPWIVRLRYGLIGGEIALIGGMAIGFQASLPIPILMAPIAVQFMTNWLLSRRSGRPSENSEHLFYLQ
jgi:hypothetical protein